MLHTSPHNPGGRLTWLVGFHLNFFKLKILITEIQFTNAHIYYCKDETLLNNQKYFSLKYMLSIVLFNYITFHYDHQIPNSLQFHLQVYNCLLSHLIILHLLILAVCQLELCQDSLEA